MKNDFSVGNSNRSGTFGVKCECVLFLLVNIITYNKFQYIDSRLIKNK